MAEPKIRRRMPGWKLELRICVVCFTGFKRKKRGNDAQLCCSRSCGFTLKRWYGERTRALYEARRDFSNWARSTRALGFKLRIDALKAKIAKRNRPCVDCGAATQGSDLRTQYCSDCGMIRKKAAATRARKTEEGRKRKRIEKARRRAIERSAIADRFDPLEVLARDGWRCHMCGISTPKRLRGSYDDRAPELDHIVPLALGGLHTRQNTACACRKCNGDKGAQHRGQLRLVA
jgi:5-methylcytosine-specific restriction endonuclease McrA